jgi:hypothetical protein
MTARAIRSAGTVLAMVLVAATATMVFAAAYARADARVSVAYDGHLRAEAQFEDYGDYFKICDRRRDNLPVAVRFSYIRRDGTRQTGTHWHTAGVDKIGNVGPGGITDVGCSYGNHNFAEKSRVWFQACVGHGGGALTCGKTIVTTTS